MMLARAVPNPSSSSVQIQRKLPFGAPSRIPLNRRPLDQPSAFTKSSINGESGTLLTQDKSSPNSLTAQPCFCKPATSRRPCLQTRALRSSSQRIVPLSRSVLVNFSKKDTGKAGEQDHEPLQVEVLKEKQDAKSGRNGSPELKVEDSEKEREAVEETVEEGEVEGTEELSELSQAEHVITVDGFNPGLIGKLRGVFDQRFQDPRATHRERFLWDYWYCPDSVGTCQYNLVRTQASAYFSPELCAELEEALIAYGESQLGCRAITPVWMSYYVDGMLQDMHCDNPHGPFAFVLSLTNWEDRRFSGGETIIAKPRLLDFWSSHSAEQGLEHHHLFNLVPPLFGRLTVFDPRFPHGVREVRGTRDPREARLVLHGWFTEPEPFFEGGLSAEKAEPVLNEALEGAIMALTDGISGDGEEEDGEPLGIHVTGTWTLRVHVDGESGRVKDIQYLADTLVPLPTSPVEGSVARAMAQHELATWLADAQFPRAENAADSTITLPIIFD